MGITAFPIVSGAQLTANDSAAKMEPGTIMAVRSNTDHWGLVMYVQLDNNGISQGQVCVTNFATLKQYSVKKAATTDHGAPMRGIAHATISSQYFGFMHIAGWVGTVDHSNTAASGEYLIISGSTAGKLTSQTASVFNAATGDTTSAFMVIARARTAAASDALASAEIVGVWG